MILPIANYAPSYDGQCLRYCYDTADFSPSWWDRSCLFVNGMHYTTTAFQQHCLVLSFLTQANVYGIFNLSEGYLKDIEQCMGDYTAIMGSATMPEEKKRAFQLLYATLTSSAKAVSDFTNIVAGCMDLASGADLKGLSAITPNFTNPAVATLYSFLDNYATYWGSDPLCLLAHSQGCLITSRALFMLEADRGGNLNLPNLYIFACASEAPYWPTSLSNAPKIYTHSNDPLTWLSLSRSYTDAQVSPYVKTLDEKDSFSDDLLFAHWINTYVPTFVGDLRNKIWSGAPPNPPNPWKEIESLKTKWGS
jgi:hypothetical protein